MLNRWLSEDHRFALADLLLVSASIFLWLVQPTSGWLPLLIAATPWFLRILAGRFPFQRTPIDLLMLFFLLTAGMGVWAAYNPTLAWEKFWLLAGGIFLFYALGNQPARHHAAIAWALTFLGIGIGIYFLFTNDWLGYPVGVSGLDRISQWWMAIRPELHSPPTQPNFVANVIAFVIPFCIAIFLKAREKGNRPQVLLAAAAILIAGICFLPATSHGVLLGLLLGLDVWLLSNRVHAIFAYIQRQETPTFKAWAALGVVAFLAASIILGGLLAGLYSTSARLETVKRTVFLINDFPFTGGGLNSFPGLYATYIVDIPTVVLPNSDNMFLDIALDQGLPGLLVFACLYAGLFWLAFRSSVSNPRSYLLGAALAGLVAFIANGLIDDILYEPVGTPLVFFLPGIIITLLRFEKPSKQPLHHPIVHRSFLLWGAALIIAAGVIIVFLNRRPILATWYANLGAVRMAQADLADFPRNKWNEGKDLKLIEPSQALFYLTLQNDPSQPVANYRLGMIAMLSRDYPKAVGYLENAYRIMPGHRGIMKALAYSYIWAGRLDQAEPLLVRLPEARQEISIYVWWWGTQGRADLSARAKAMVNQLSKVSQVPALMR